MRYSLEAKALDGTPVRPRDPHPGMLQRANTVDLDPGRPWAGDLYNTGAPTDPEQAYARFTGDDVDGEEVTAWVDRTTDGTLTGWVRQGMRVWRYTDPQAWALDVDGAQMKRTGGQAPDVDTDDNPDDPANDVVEDAPHPSSEDAERQIFSTPEEAEDPEALLEADEKLKKGTQTKTLRLVVHPKA